MIFNSYLFLGLFLPAILIMFYMPQLRDSRALILLGASFLFYGYSGIQHAFVLFFDIIWVYCITRINKYQERSFLLLLAIIVPALLLVYYKYLGFFLNDVLMLDAGTHENSEHFDLYNNLILPAGISFFTFQVVAYAVDRYKNRVDPAKGFVNFAVYVSFFPQLIAGPIVRFGEVRDQFLSLHRFKLDAEKLSIAIRYMVAGLAVKVLIADWLGELIEPMVNQPGAGSPIWAIGTIFGYSFQIYFDFFGYSLIAIGLGRLFGVQLPINFDMPYRACNPRDFWRRWHISLSYWIRDYIYLPLGGNKHYIRNILLVFLFAGLWHGAGWSFVIWGLCHGILVAFYHVASPIWDRLSRLGQVLLNFTALSVVWLFFIYDFSELRMFILSFCGLGSNTLPEPGLEMLLALIVAAAMCFGIDLNKWATRTSTGKLDRVLVSTTTGFAFIVSLLFIGRSGTFIYFRF